MKNYVVGIYSSHKEANLAVEDLIAKGFSKKHLSVIGRAEEIEGQLHFMSNDNSAHSAPVAVGTSVGALAGILTGVGIFAIPGLGFLYGAGALVGAIAGFDFGLIGGGAVSLFETLTDDKHDLTIDEHLQTHHVAVLYNGEDRDKVVDVMHDQKAIDVYS